MGIKLETVPQTSSKGNQLKYYDDEKRVFYKVDTKGYESIAEVLVSTLCMFIEDIDYVDYSLAWYNGKCACSCKSYLGEGEVDRSLVKIMRGFYSEDDLNHFLGRGGKEAVDFVLSFVKDNLGIDIEEYLGRLIYLDAIVLNEDRHYNNIGFIFSKGKYRPTPYFDFGSGLMSDLSIYRMGVNPYIVFNYAVSRPFCDTFDEQVKLFNVNPLEIDINGFLKYLKCVDDNINDSIPFKQKEYSRAKKVLLSSLKKWEGILWKKYC